MFPFAPKNVRLRDGQEVLIRPLKEDDLPRWCEMIRSCSEETLWKRFERRSHEVILGEAQRFCCPSQDELVIVAELEGKIVGEARLCKVPETKDAEFCVLVADPWQGRGLGSILTDLALECADRMGIERVVVEVVSENLRILNLLRSRGFRFFGEEIGILWGERLGTTRQRKCT